MKRLLRGLALAAALAFVSTPTASAIPDSGAGPDTPGTSASASPSTLRAGDTLSFRISGFPAGEIVYVKIDDGQFCAQAGVHGACVVHQQRISANGSVSGSLVLPADLKPGKHWLRFLASEEMFDSQGTYQGVKGYTLRGGANFTVTAGSSSNNNSGNSDNSSSSDQSSDDSSNSSSSSEPGSSATSTDDVVAAGKKLTLELPKGVKAPKTSDDNSAGTDEETASTEDPVEPETTEVAPTSGEQTTQAAADPDDPFPFVGTGVLVVAVVGAGLVLRRGLRARG
ncbi:hypothetical protein [Nocardioides alcanivorans]|uniref:hypothetical protein n=1 Tax=Nocardioides alcanivorans TaxID=2897352 RepID=UPI001F42DC60|nr:hypothetical protein [Nocardioides alcanivorans]